MSDIPNCFLNIRNKILLFDSFFKYEAEAEQHRLVS